MIKAISSLSSLEASMGSLLDIDSSFFSSVALNATGCTSGVEEADDFLGAFDHQFKAHKFSYCFLGRH
jgi:hypothetical protein